MATSYFDDYHMGLIAAMNQIFGEQSTADSEPETRPRPRAKAVKAPATTGPERTEDGIETT
ncbi:hypothetical protein IU500_06950 [Nocardia terpenica]|uniref:hypothetical protein n=1 Tax=Nocardia terpenica TaxID=455432 RepID=UPI001895B19A|nr:hypothetical protein [Nocardia terpenica]MBF6060514.1 hypothetical protein [Nocardia terpenica]MBF6103774.1 hypothetical protein [Nocardia terpenica]MBF6111852.1 hypothetical protein [Nocardia terpenica]MBF6117995.1 hypothetical protein [Nocardia terpenica]MBF6155279.1 hypothetical protein [Nocardia terpenica]